MEILGFAVGVGSTEDGVGTYGSASYLAPYVNEGISLAGTTSIFDVVLEKPRQELWASYYFRFHDNSMQADTLFALIDSQGNEVVRLTSASTEYISFDYKNAEGTWVTLGSKSWDYNAALSRIDVAFTADRVALYWDNVLLGETTDTQLSEYPVEKIQFQCNDIMTFYVSSIFAADSDTRDVHMAQHTIDGNGAVFGDFDGDYTQAISGFGVRSALSADTAESTHTFTKSAAITDLEATHDIAAVGVYSRASRTIDGEIGALTGVVTDGVNTLEMDSMPLTEEVQGLTFTAPLAPDGTAWDLAKVDACEVGLRAKA